MMKHQFDLVIKSKTSDVTLSFNATLGKWEALKDNKVIARRKNVTMLVQAINAPVAEAA